MVGYVFDGYLSKYPPLMADDKLVDVMESLNAWAEREFGIDRILAEKRIAVVRNSQRFWLRPASYPYIKPRKHCP